jgi:hypothetical protein
MTTGRDTSHLIKTMASDAGTPADEAWLSFDAALIVAVVLSCIGALLLLALVFGIQPHMAAVVATSPFQFKVTAMAVLGCGAALVVRHLGRPGSSGLAFAALIPGVVVLLAGAALDRSGFPLTGASDLSVPICVAYIVLLSLPPLAILLGTLKTGVLTRPAMAGAAAGMLAGAIGGAAYAFVCKNDGAGFVAIWYPVAIVSVAALGALVGRRWLAW